MPKIEEDEWMKNINHRKMVQYYNDFN